MDQEFEQFLEDISTSFLQRDLSLWRSRLVVPFSLVTKSQHIFLKTEDQVHNNFNLYLKAMDAMALNFIDRSPVHLHDCEDGTWLGSFQTRLLIDEIFVVPPYTSTALLQIVDNRFRMSALLNARGHLDWTGVNEA